MIGIHVVHRRLAELTLKAEQHGGYHTLSELEQQDLNHCLKVNAKLVRELDELKSLSFIAHQAGDVVWQHEICQQIDSLHEKLI